MADSSEPPAKRARLDVDAPDSGDASLDAPGSPVDDSDDDFYETPALKLAPGAGAVGGPSSSSTLAAAPAQASSQLPGLGLWSESPAQQSHTRQESAGDEASEDGEVSDTEALYGDIQPAPSAAVDPGPDDTLQQNGDDDATALLLEALRPSPPANVKPHDRPAPGATNAPPAVAATAADTAAAAGRVANGKKESAGKTVFLEAAKANQDTRGAEWELDSEASDVDSSSDSSSADSSAEEGEESDGELLDPEEAIKRMLAEDPEDAATETKAKVKTQNELDETYVKPNIDMTDTTKITEVGKVESIVENVVLIKANVSGNYRVLETGSALCLGDRNVIGQVSETMGRVQDPRYSVGFSDEAEIAALGITQGTPIFYVDEHSKFVLTEPLRAEKHTDASGQYDEETRNQEFSDDEEEAKFKSQVKREKAAKQGKSTGDGEFNPPKGPAALIRSGSRQGYREQSQQPSMYQGGGLKYSDDEDEDLGMYKPLARPDRFEDLVGAGAPLEDRSHVRRGMMRGGRGGWQDRGRGFRGRGNMGPRGRPDRAPPINQGGRGDHGHGGRGDNQNRGGRADRGDRPSRGHDDRHGRQQEQRRQGSGSPPDPRRGRRGTFSPAASQPPPSQGRRQEQHRQEQQRQEQQRQEQQRQGQHVPRTGKGKNRKRNRHSSPNRTIQGPNNRNADHHGNNNMQENKHDRMRPHAQQQSAPASYPASNPAALASAPSHVPAGPSHVPAAAPAPFAHPGFLAQQQPAPIHGQSHEQLQNMAQWYQLAVALSQAQGAQQPAYAAAPPPPPPPVQHPPQYQQPYHYQQPVAPPPMVPPPDPRRAYQQPAASTQGSGPSIQDILRALGGGSGS